MTSNKEHGDNTDLTSCKDQEVIKNSTMVNGNPTLERFCRISRKIIATFCIKIMDSDLRKGMRFMEKTEGECVYMWALEQESGQ